MNEELQSGNGKLEAEEGLRALNEELTRVNLELRDRVAALEQARDDLSNLFSSTNIATVILDARLCLTRFTPAAAELLSIGRGDVGSRAADIPQRLLQERLEEDAKAVLESTVPRSRELATSDGRWFFREVLPYRTEARRIEGVTVAFIDITKLKTVTESLKQRERQQAIIARVGLLAVQQRDLQGFLDRAVREIQAGLDADCCKVLELQPGGKVLLLRAGVGWSEGLVGSAWVGTGSDSQAGFTLRSTEPVVVRDFASEQRFTGPRLLTEHRVVSGLSCVIRDGDRVHGVLGAHALEARDFTSDDVNFLQAVASMIGSTVSRYLTRLRLALEHGIAQALARPTTRESALSEVLECFANELLVDVGEVWLASKDRSGPDRDAYQLPYLERWADDLAGRASGLGEGLLKIIVRDRAAVWWTDIANPHDFRGQEKVRQLGLRSGFGFPISSGGKLLGAITVYSRARIPADENFLRNLAGIGRSIGEFLVRTESEQTAARLAAILASSHDAITSYDLAGTITEWLVGSEQLYGYSAQEMVGSSILRIVPEDRREEFRLVNERIMRGESVEPFETRRRGKDGRMVTVSVRNSPIKEADGRIVGVSSSDRDMTRQKDLERGLRDANRQKDEFLAMLGHELRNPLSAIHSATELMRMSAEHDPDLQQAGQILDRQCTHMSKLIDGLLDVSRIMHGKILLEMSTVDLVAICRDVWTDVVARCGGRSLQLREELPSNPVWVEGDRVRLSQVLDNLLSNAVKYTDDGGLVTLKLSRELGEAVVAVRDTGIGIEPALLPSVFEPFRQGEQKLERFHGGLGLGLALVQSLVQLHAGRVTAHSAGEGRGAEFVVRIPLSTGRRPSPARLQTEPGRPVSVLLIEDHADSAKALSRLLEMAGHRVAAASEGRHGLALAKETQPDVVLCDLGLPGDMTGYDVARSLREDPRTRGIRLIAITGYGRPEDQRKCLEAGFDSHLTKPVNIAALERLLRTP